ncbi:MAG: glycosyltransferase, partial [Hydrogenothermaceae bacterium]|nr:glycosyltransferase [Hydrogenothermaceae bacterium]
MEKFSSRFNATKPIISCIMSCYSEIPEHLCMAIESILNQTYQNFEFLIALDNPDNKELLKILRVYEEKDKRIKVFVNPKNLGRSQSRNNLIKKAQGDYIAIMDADDIAYPDRFEVEVAVLEEGICDIVGSWIEEFDDNPEVITSVRKVPEKHDDI